MRDRSAPTSSCRSVAMRVRTRSSASSRATRIRYAAWAAAASARTTAARNQARCQNGAGISIVSSAGAAGSPSPESARTSRRCSPGPSRGSSRPRASEGSLQSSSCAKRYWYASSSPGAWPIARNCTATRWVPGAGRSGPIRAPPSSGSGMSSPSTCTPTIRGDGGGRGSATSRASRASPCGSPNHRSPRASRTQRTTVSPGSPSARVKSRVAPVRSSMRTTPRSLPK